MTAMWMVRAGERGFRFDDFERLSTVCIGWSEMGDLSQLTSREHFRRATSKSYPAPRKAQAAVSAGQTFRFVREMKAGDGVMTYSPTERRYLVGTITGDYAYDQSLSHDQPNIRSVKWRGSLERDRLSVPARNSLGAISTVFVVPHEAAQEVEALLSNPSATAPDQAVDDTQLLVAERQQVEDIYRDIHARGVEFIKDKVIALDWEEMQELVAGLLRAMGYKTRISPSGSDRGKDIVASRDGLGFEDPRIVVEVKHRTAQIGSQQIRSFLGGRHESDKGLYVSTGGFSKDARYEAERGRIPVTLMDIDDLVTSLLEHYERLDMETQRLLPLRKVYWPT